MTVITIHILSEDSVRSVVDTMQKAAKHSVKPCGRDSDQIIAKG